MLDRVGFYTVLVPQLQLWRVRWTGVATVRGRRAFAVDVSHGDADESLQNKWSASD